MHSQVSHAAVFAVELDHTLPINRLFRVQIATVEKSGFAKIPWQSLVSGLMAGKSCRTQSNGPGLRLHTATISGRADMSVKWHHRAAALANSRPIIPQPIIPKRMVFIQILDC